MKANIGSSDKVIRLVLGVIIIVLGFYFNSWWGVIGLVPIITVVINFCPIYGMLGISTNKKIKTEKL